MGKPRSDVAIDYAHRYQTLTGRSFTEATAVWFEQDKPWSSKIEKISKVQGNQGEKSRKYCEIFKVKHRILSKGYSR